MGAIPVLLALSSRPDPLRSAISALFDHRWEYPLVPAIGGSDQAARFACLRLRDDIVPALADAADVRGDARSGKRRPKQPFG